MNGYFKKFILCFCFFCFLVVNTRPQSVNAVAGVDDALVLGGAGATATIGTGAFVALIGSSLVAAGVMLDSTANDGQVCKYIAQKMISGGSAAQYVGTQISSTGQTFLTWTKDGLSYFQSTVQNLLTSGMPVSSDYCASGSSFYLLKGSLIHIHSVDYNGTITMPSSQNVTIAMTPGSKGRISISVVGSSYGCLFSAELTSPSYTIDYNNSSVCVPLPTSYNNYNLNDDVIGSDITAKDGSISYQPKVGIPLTLGSDSVTYSPDVSIPYGKTWGDISSDLGITYPQDTTGDIPSTGVADTTGTINTGTGVLNIPILGDILKALLNILQFLKDMIGNFITALTKMLTDLFVPTAGIFENFFNDLSLNIKNKFPYSPNILNSLKVSADEFGDIKAFGGVIVSAKFIKDNISFIRTVTSCFWIFALFVYIWRRINSILNGGGQDRTEIIDIGRR